MKNRIQIVAQIGIMQLQADAEFSDEIVMVSGENGAGKTTLLRCLAGLEDTEGQILVRGKTWLDSSAGFLLPSQARQIGCVWTDVALLPWLSVERNILLGAELEDAAWLAELAGVLEISPLLQRRPSMLSTGEAQRVALARAIYKRPSVLLLDEPFSAQAPAIRQRLRVVLKSIHTALNMPVIMVSHDVEDAASLADQHWRMREGRLLKEIEVTGMNKVKQA